MSGSVTHFEIPVDDMARAQAFYRDAFGWQFSPNTDIGYVFARTTPIGADGLPLDPGAINGGLVPREEPFLAPILTVTVDDVDSALAAIEGFGGQIVVGRTPVGGMGFAAYAKDTEGNLIGLWESVAP